jgi:L-ribulose-5-phosphate 4-epimerase
MPQHRLKKIVCEQNKRLAKTGLVILTEGNVSQITPDRRYVVIKPSGIPYENLTPNKMVVVDIKSGKVKSGSLKPSSDTLTHIEIYKNFPEVIGIAHTHSPFATAWAQTGKEIPCYGTTHADLHYSAIPITRHLTNKEIEKDYEINIGKAINEILSAGWVPSVLVNKHGPFCFGSSAEESVDHSIILEKIAMMAVFGRTNSPISKKLHGKHYNRKHGKDKYYGQKKGNS